ncbi:sensor histidine kinase [Nocardia terpenica]|uniref:histidine kinase n=1 Tax=Nocardia terpenica TaxID=455432 RepID=A0A164J403_9NOCA|nr:sensor histidine kinase [Nocardia terpenica]KZM70022.1 hypothetical protein AWN90_05380 [Nocardia terpenica]NQE91411.1 sensor histidine kinase [Nocardia terpenica]
MRVRRIYDHARAVGRGLIRFTLGPVELLVFAISAVAIAGTCVGLVFLYPPVAVRARPLTALARRLSGAWSGIPIAAPYRPAPPPPVLDADGLYRTPDGAVFPSARSAAFGRMSRWVWTDPATWRDLLWSLTDPFVGGALAIAPAALLCAGIAALSLWHGVFGAIAGVACLAAGWFGAPGLLRLHGRWTRLLLAPASPTAVGRGVVWRRRLGAGVLSGVRCVMLAGLSLLALPQLATLLVAVVCTGPVVTSWVLAKARWLPNLFRRLAFDWSGREITIPYLSTPRLGHDPARSRSSSAWWGTFAGQARALWYDPSSGRDLLWLICQPLAAPVLLLPAALIGYGCWGLVLPVLEQPLGATLSPWYGELFGSTAAALIAGLACTATGLAAAPRLLELHGRWLSVLLAPTARARLLADRERLTARVERLTETRTAATETLAAELRRIERDLHDGAQARLVAMGMTLGAVEELIDRDPRAAKALVAQARQASVSALAELRALVRGIHPPVLAERGLIDAVRALALDSPVPVRVDADLPGPVDTPAESALYFAVTEVLTNAIRHAQARHIEIGIHRHDATLRITVRDDGIGGADPRRGSGLHGVERRLSSFDGRVVVDSPVGGPTMVTMELPCALSSRRTSSSSETA